MPQFAHPWEEEGLVRAHCELGRAGQEQRPLGFLLKLPIWALCQLPLGYGGTVTLKNHCQYPAMGGNAAVWELPLIPFLGMMLSTAVPRHPLPDVLHLGREMLLQK